MLIHKDTVEGTVLNQMKSLFQTVISIKEIRYGQNISNLKECKEKLAAIAKYDIQLSHQNRMSAKVKLHVIFNFRCYNMTLTLLMLSVYFKKDETVHLDETFHIERIEKHIKNAKQKKVTAEVKEEDPLFKDLTFNVHLNDDDMEAKKNLILPYEIVG